MAAESLTGTAAPTVLHFPVELPLPAEWGLTGYRVQAPDREDGLLHLQPSPSVLTGRFRVPGTSAQAQLPKPLPPLQLQKQPSFLLLPLQLPRLKPAAQIMNILKPFITENR